MANLVGSVVSAVTNFALVLVLARTMPQDDVGSFFTITSVFLMLTTVGQLGTATGLVYFIGGSSAAEWSSTAPAYVRTASIPVVVFLTLSAAVVVGASGWLASLLSLDGVEGGQAGLVLSAIAMPAAAVLNLYTSATRGLGSMRATVYLDQIVRPLLQLAGVFGAVLTGRVELVVLAWAVPYVPTAVASVLWWRRDLGAPAGGDRPAGLTRAFWRFTAPRALAGGAQLAMQRLDIVLVSAMAGLTEAAIYTAATRFLVVGQFIGKALAQAVQPQLARSVAAGDADRSNDLYRTATAWLVLVAWPFYLAMCPLAVPFLLLFGADYVSGAAVVVILAVTMLVATGTGMVDTVLLMAGKSSWNLVNVLIAFAINLGLDLLLIPQYGMVGAALGWAAGIACANLLPLAQIWYALRMHPFGPATLNAMGLSLTTMGLVPILTYVVSGADVVAVVVSLVLGSLLWAGGCWLRRDQLEVAPLLKALRLGRRGPSRVSSR